MESMVYRWLTGAGVVAACVSLGIDMWGDDRLQVRSGETVSPITVLVVERNGATPIPYAVCTVPQVTQ